MYYARPDGEVVSDVRTVDITECLLNTVNVSWSHEKVQPGEQATLKMTAEPLSLCSIGKATLYLDLKFEYNLY